MNALLLEEFASKTAGLIERPKSVFPSEMFLFWCTAKLFRVDQIIESGIGHGGSTDYLDCLFSDIPITSIDRNFADETRERHPRIKFIKGDGRWELPFEVHFSKGERIAILIDGPKGWMAMTTALRILQNSKVAFVAIHDLQSELKSPFYEERSILKNRLESFLSKANVNSHAPEIRAVTARLDSYVKAAIKYPDGPGLSIYHA